MVRFAKPELQRYLADLSSADGRNPAVSAGRDVPAVPVFSDEHEYLVIPGLCDVHVHFREPGFSYQDLAEFFFQCHNGKDRFCLIRIGLRFRISCRNKGKAEKMDHDQKRKDLFFTEFASASNKKLFINNLLNLLVCILLLPRCRQST